MADGLSPMQRKCAAWYLPSIGVKLGKTMNRVQKNKLKGSKWTAQTPIEREKHFIVTRVYEYEDRQLEIVLEAVHSGREYVHPWTVLKDATVWRHGWR